MVSVLDSRSRGLNYKSHGQALPSRVHELDVILLSKCLFSSRCVNVRAVPRTFCLQKQTPHTITGGSGIQISDQSRFKK